MLPNNTKTLELNIHHLTRVEGHGNIVVDVKNGILTRCEFDVIEAPRFFESMMRGRKYSAVPTIASRICGICSVAHKTASIRAIENALDIKVSEQTKLLRKLIFLAEVLDSHILHVFMLAAPDFLGLESVVSLAKKNPEIVTLALSLKKLAGDICFALGGRHTHPIALTIGGFSHFPLESELHSLQERLELARPAIDVAVEVFQTLEIPEFERETEYLSLSKDGEYSFIDGEIISSDGGAWSAEKYQSVTNETLVSHSTAKHARHLRESYMVGALSRFKLNYDALQPKAKEAARTLGLSPASINPYHITTAQLVETVHGIDEAIGVIDRILNNGIADESLAEVRRKSGEGVGACEAPRGMLFHHYRIQGGLITEADCVIPTGQNLANIEADMRALLPTVLGRSEDEIKYLLEMLVRAYDPCISCSTHMLEVNFV